MELKKYNFSINHILTTYTAVFYVAYFVVVLYTVECPQIKLQATAFLRMEIIGMANS